MKRAIVIGACLACWPARAGVFKNIGRDVAAGAVEKIQPVLTATLAQAEASATRLEDHVAVVAGTVLEQANAKGKERLDQVNGILEARMLQAQLEIKDVTDHALSGVGALIDSKLDKVAKTATDAAKELLKDLDKTVKTTLDLANDALKSRIADVGREINNAIDKADHTLAERLAQVDEIVGRRLGNVDVIASKQRVAIEETALRTAVLIGLVVFTVFVLRGLYARYSKLSKKATKGGGKKANKHGGKDLGKPTSAGGEGSAEELRNPWGPRGGKRTLMFARGLGVPLIGHLVVAGLGAGVLFVLYDRLPLGARSEAIALVAVHRNGFTDSLKRFDFGRARFHASQLEYLAPDDPTAHGALIAKAELLRDVFLRPTLLATEPGIAGLWKRLDENRRLMSPQVDPDLLVVEAMLLWETGDSRHQELRAASLCARALRVRTAPGGFALAPLARAYIETFVDAPYIDDNAGLGRDSYALDDLRAVLDYAATEDSAHPLAKRIQIVRLMRIVDGASSTAYAEMIQAHALVIAEGRVAAAKAKGAAAEAQGAAAKGKGAAAKGKAATREKDPLKEQRLEAAKRVLTAWRNFDEALADPELARDPSVLLVFRLNDAQFVRAKWFVDNPDTNELAPLLVAAPKQLEDTAAAEPADRPATQVNTSANPPRSARPEDRIMMLSPRLVWARRYRTLIDGPARALFELQEANRFAALEAAAFAFEREIVRACVASGTNATATPRTCQWDPRELPRAAEAAAALGLYVSDSKVQSPRSALARKLLHARPERGTPAAASSKGKQPTDQPTGDGKQPSPEQQAQQAMLARGIRLL
jgi:hypothetical protein